MRRLHLTRPAPLHVLLPSVWAHILRCPIWNVQFNFSLVLPFANQLFSKLVFFQEKSSSVCLSIGLVFVFVSVSVCLLLLTCIIIYFLGVFLCITWKKSREAKTTTLSLNGRQPECAPDARATTVLVLPACMHRYLQAGARGEGARTK